VRGEGPRQHAAAHAAARGREERLGQAPAGGVAREHVEEEVHGVAGRRDVLHQTVVELTTTRTEELWQTLVDPAGNAVAIDPAQGGSINDVTPAGLSVPGLDPFSGVAVNDAKGFSAVLHNVTNQAMIGGVVSNATERSIGNKMNIDVTVNNVKALRNLGIQSRIVNALSR